MSLITCPECNKHISDHAAACPHCGYPLTANAALSAPAVAEPSTHRKRRSSAGRILLIIGIGLFLYFFLLSDTSVPIYSDPISALRGGFGSSRVNNLGLMQDRTLGCVAGIGIIVVGAIVLVSERRRKV